MDRCRTKFRAPHFEKRLTAFLLAFVMVLNIFLSIGPTATAASESSEYTTSETVIQDGIAITTKKTLSYSGNNTYKLVLDATSAVSRADETSTRNASKDGVFTVPKGGAGYYLLELWGGAGGRGETIYYLLTDATFQGGQGGQAGYTYGLIYLNEGDQLVYTLGTKGGDLAFYETGSGENEGGDAGSNGLRSVGGGGGYSAIYLFRNTDNHTSGAKISNSERLSKYIMIAAGGGGGGAANDQWYPQSGRADGGRGGIAGVSASGHLTADKNNGVAGTYFAGSNGSSAGDDVSPNTKYVGIGGSAKPGRLNETYFGLYEATSGNDWVGTYNTALNPGSGGNGNFRGGAGGAGFTGGSGGIMASAMVAANVGGGGGGASFISDAVEYKDLSSVVKDFLNGYKNNDNKSKTGGKVIITFLGDNEKTLADTSSLKNVTITGQISKYFDVINAVTTNGSLAKTNDGTITVSNADIAPGNDGFSGTGCRITLTLRAKEGFLGGNMVPLLAKDFTFTPSGKPTLSYVKDAGADYCNVPLSLTAKANSYSSVKTNPRTFQLSELYTDEYADLRSSLASHWEADFIQSIGTYQVLVQGTSNVLNSAVTPTTDTRYTVRFLVNLKNDAAKIGPATAKSAYITATSVITMAEENEILIGADSAKLVVSKGLSYQNGEYHFTVDLNGSRNISDVPYQRLITSTAGNTSDGNDLTQAGGQNHWTVSVSGWYAIAAQGGHGGNGGNAKGTGVLGSTGTATGGKGAQGGFVNGLVYLQKGDEITWHVGAAGANGASDTDSDYANAGGGGGGGVYSWICRNGSWLILANGGGGGGGAAASYYWTSEYTSNGKSAVRQTAISEDFGYSHRGTNGSAGTATNSSATGGNAGLSGRQTQNGNTACTNYRVSGVVVSQSVDGRTLSAPTESSIRTD